LKNGIYGNLHVKQQRPTLIKQLTGPISPVPVFKSDWPGLSCPRKIIFLLEWVQQNYLLFSINNPSKRKRCFEFKYHLILRSNWASRFWLGYLFPTSATLEHFCNTIY